MKPQKILPLTALLLCFTFPLWRRTLQELQPPDNYTPPPEFKLPTLNTYGRVPGNVQNAIDDLTAIYAATETYRKTHNGTYPENWGDLFQIVGREMAQGHPNTREENKLRNALALTVFTNPDTALSDLPGPRGIPDSFIAYPIGNRRPDGTLLGSPKPPGTRDVLAYTTIYFHRNNFPTHNGAINNPVGYFPVLWDTGEVEIIPFDMAPLFSSPTRGLVQGFPGMAGLPFETLSYAEFWVNQNSPEAPIGKPVPDGFTNPVPDNGAPESLVNLSRRINFPNQYGIPRDKLWQTVDPGQPKSSLRNLQYRVAKLGLNLTLASPTIKQLAATANPAILFLREEPRLVTLNAIDDDLAVITDRGLTKIIARETLEKRYSGQALVPENSLDKPSPIQVENPIRTVPIPDQKSEVPEQFHLQNQGSTSIDLQIQGTPLGTTEASLSQKTLAPGESATLDVKLKWRQILKTPTQTVLIDLETNNPAHARLQLACLLTRT